MEDTNIGKPFTFYNFIWSFLLRRKNQKNELEEINQQLLDGEKRFDKKLLANTDPQQGRIISTLQTRISTIERDLMVLKTKVNKPSPPPPPPPPPPKPSVIKKYSEYPDNPMGFQVISLSDTETPNSRYEITLQNENSATFIFKASPKCHRVRH